MNPALSQPKRKGFVSSSTLVLFAFATAFFSRVLDSFGAPSAINFLHFATIPFACWVAIFKSRSRDPEQISIVQSILVALWILLIVIFASALLNGAGEVNAILDFLLLGEPFIFLLAIVCVPMTKASFDKFQTWLIRFCLFHIFLALVQKYVLRYDVRYPDGPDNIQGVFFRSGAGHVVGASVALTFGVYFLLYAKKFPLWVRGSVMLAAFWQLLLADAKQVLTVFIVSFGLLLVTKLQDIGKAIQYITIGVVFLSIFIWCVQNVPAFDAFNTWIRPEIYGPDGEATRLKFATFRIVPGYYESALNWWLGLGPGHTVGRLGGWMLTVYWDLLGPLGATRSFASADVWAAVGESWLGSQSSFFSPLFGWAGIWGDLGFLGLGSYLYLAWLVWSRLCSEDFTKFLLMNVFVFGLIFSQMEEPGYMLFVALCIGLRWQEKRVASLGDVR